jgi:nitrate/nitrite-specific signal transduction histidine kinase
MARLATKPIPNKRAPQDRRTEADLQRDRAILDALDEDQSRLAQELHDTLCQTLSGLRLSAAALRRKSADLAGQAAAECAHLEEVAAKSIGELHEILRSLQSLEVSPADLAMVLEELARETKPSMHCDFRVSGSPMVANAFIASQVARIARAVLKHAHSAGSVQKVRMEWQDTANQSILLIAADCACFGETEGSPERLLGWKLLLRRAAAIGATVNIEEDGAAVRLTIPAVPIQSGN